MPLFSSLSGAVEKFRSLRVRLAAHHSHLLLSALYSALFVGRVLGLVSMPGTRAELAIDAGSVGVTWR